MKLFHKYTLYDSKLGEAKDYLSIAECIHTGPSKKNKKK